MTMQSSLEKLNSLWHKRCCVEKMPIPLEFPLINSPFDWALNIAQSDPELVSTAMRWVFKDGPQDDKMLYVSRGNATEKVKKAMISGVQQGAAIQLQINGINFKYPPIQDFMHTRLMPFVEKAYPFGSLFHASLWITGGGHIYNSHCDLGDHLLIQLSGEKHVKFWGPAADFDLEHFYNFDFRNDSKRFNGEIKDVVLHPGEMVFFSKGTMHQVAVPEQNEGSVSVAISADHLYPVLTCIQQINQMYNQNLIVKEAFSGWDKFSAYLFDPNRYIYSIGDSMMPKQLLSSFKEIILNSNENTEKYLNEWWKHYSISGKYSPTGTLPLGPSNKEEILKAWESQRLSD